MNETAIAEREWLAQIRDLARIYRWTTYHPYLSIRSAPGWPDLALVRPPRLILVELKTEIGKLTVNQTHWLDLLNQCDTLEVDVWRPSHLDRIAELLK